MKRVLLVFTVLFSAFAFVSPTIAQTPKKKGETIFGENRKATMKAMRGISKAIGEKCTYCHVKIGGKVVYEKDTDHKRAARQMKSTFIDSLVANGQTEASFDHHGKTKTIGASFATEGENAGIHLEVQEGAGKPQMIKVDLPKKGEALSCATCHGGKVHIFSGEEEKK